MIIILLFLIFNINNRNAIWVFISSEKELVDYNNNDDSDNNYYKCKLSSFSKLIISNIIKIITIITFSIQRLIHLIIVLLKLIYSLKNNDNLHRNGHVILSL